MRDVCIETAQSAKNLHFYVLFIDGVFSHKSSDELKFYWVNAHTPKELNALVAMLSEWVARSVKDAPAGMFLMKSVTRITCYSTAKLFKALPRECFKGF